jgi:MYXO-CTERM domain-containing protein
MTSFSLVSTAVASLALGLVGVAHAQTQTCAQDSDCGSGMVCHSQTSTSCSGSGGTAPACPANMLCPDAGIPIVTTPVCTESTTWSCTYKWMLPCMTGTDCGDGFDCQPLTRGECTASSGSASGGTVSSGSGTSGSSGSSGVGGGSGAAPPVAADAGMTSTCVTTTSFPGTCQPKNSICVTDSDCPALFTCKDVTSGGGQPVVIRSMDAGVPEPPPTTTTSTTTSAKTCQSPYGSVTIGDHGGAVPTAGGQGADAGATTKGATSPPVTPGSSDTANTTATQTSTETAAKTGGGGCSMVKSGSASAAWLALLGLLALLAWPRQAQRQRRDR